jgi:hypothetical protein
VRLAIDVPLARAGAAARPLRATQEQITPSVNCNGRDAAWAGGCPHQTQTRCERFDSTLEIANLLACGFHSFADHFDSTTASIAMTFAMRCRGLACARLTGETFEARETTERL